MKNNAIFDFGKWKPVIVYSIIWLIAYGAFFLAGSGGAMAYWMIVFWVVLPLAAIMTAVQAGRNRAWMKSESLFLAVFYGVMYMLAPYVTFGLANVRAFGHRSTVTGLEIWLLIPGMLFFIAGFVIGRGMNSRRR